MSVRSYVREIVTEGGQEKIEHWKTCLVLRVKINLSLCTS